MTELERTLRAASLVFWDFDGVIKETVSVKGVAFEQLFLPYGREVAARVRQHHEDNGGVSRFEKMPLYLAWAGQPASPAQVDVFCAQFAQSVHQAVIDAAWVPGVREYIEAYCGQQRFVLVTAAPQQETEQVMETLKLGQCFQEIHGAPAAKAVVVRDVLTRWHCAPADALVVGDSDADFEAAAANGVSFVLRRTYLNGPLQGRHSGLSFEELS